MVVPTFVVAGAMKSGTTWIDEMLRSSTNATLPHTTKELFYFDQFWDRGEEWYSRQFDPTWRREHGPLGEVASTYYADPDAAERLSAIAPRASIVIVLRNPWERSWSHYRHLIRKGEVAPGTDFSQAVSDRPDLIEWSRYVALLQPWEEHFGEHLHVLRYEQLTTDPDGFAALVAQAIGATLTHGNVTSTPVNSAREPRSYAAAKVTGVLSRRLHEAGLHRVVEVAKRLGASRLVERSSSSADPDIRFQAMSQARALLKSDADELTARLNWPTWT